MHEGLQQWGPSSDVAMSRPGRLVFDKLMVYGTAGLMYAAGSATLTVQPPGSQELRATNSSWHLGYTVGAGPEWAFARDWTARVEYLYADLGSASYALDTQSAPNITANLDAKMQLNFVRRSPLHARPGRNNLDT